MGLLHCTLSGGLDRRGGTWGKKGRILAKNLRIGRGQTITDFREERFSVNETLESREKKK